MQQKINDIITHIAENLYQSIKDKNDGQIKRIGLMDGMCGIALFYAYYSKYNVKYSQICNQIIEDIIETIDNNEISFHYSEGITGFAWLLEHFVQNDFIDEDDVNEILADFDEIITIHLNKEIENMNFDFLYGAMGIGNYFLLRNKRKDCSKQLNSIVTALKQSAVKDKVGIKWKSMFKPELNIYNYGFAHGHTSIIGFLNKFLKSNPSNQSYIIQHLLNPAIEHLLSKGIYEGKKDSNIFIPTDIFDVILNEKEMSMRNTWGWCYGDLIIAWVLYGSAKILNDKKLFDKVSEIMASSCERKNLELNHIDDAHFCHGASSIFHIFNKYKQDNNNKLYSDIVDYWFNQVLNLLSSKKDSSGFKYYNDGEWENRFFLLHGDAGVGLTLLSYLKPELMTWDECFLLS